MVMIGTLLVHLFMAVIHLALISLDVVFFFVFARFLALKWPKGIFARLDRVGSPLTDPMCEAMERTFCGLSAQLRLLLLATALTLCRLGITDILLPLASHFFSVISQFHFRAEMLL